MVDQQDSQAKSMRYVETIPAQVHFRGKGDLTMTDKVRLPRKLSDEPEAPMPVRPSHQKVIEQVERWANSPGLQPPRTDDAKTV